MSYDTDRGRITCDVVVNAGGIFAHELGRLAGVNVPIVPMAHDVTLGDDTDREPAGIDHDEQALRYSGDQPYRIADGCRPIGNGRRAPHQITHGAVDD